MPAKALRGQKLAEEILRLADRLEGKFRKAFLRSVLKLSEDPTLRKLIDEIDKGKLSFGDSVETKLANVRIDMAEMNEIARQAIAGSAKVTGQVMNLTGSFDVVNDAVIDAAKKLSVELSTNLTKTAKENLRQIIEDQLSGNISRQEAVRRITLEVGLIPAHSKAVNNYRKTLISAGTPRGKANQLAEQYAKRLLKYRADTISRTEVARATGIGQTNFWRQMRDQGSLPPSANRVWITALDERACDFCRSMNGQVATIDGGWETPNGYMEYPQAAHPRCRCSSGITTRRPTKTGQLGRISKIEEIEWDRWIAKAKVGDKPGHPFRGNQWVTAGSDLPRKGRLKTTEDDLPAGHESATPFTREEYAALGAQADKNSESLSGDEQNSFGHYFGDNYTGINNLLRHGDNPEWESRIVGNRYYELMQEYVGGLETGYAKMAVEMPRETSVYRGVHVPKGQEFQVGDVIQDKTYSSTTANSDVAIRFAGTGEEPALKPQGTVSTVLAIVLPKGYKAVVGGKMAHYGSEKEVLLDKNVKMKVVAVEKLSVPAYNVSCDKVTVEIVP